MNKSSMSSTVDVVVVTRPDEDSFKRIQGVSDRVKADLISQLLAAEKKGDQAAKEEADSLLARAEVLYGWIPHFPRNLIARAPGLKWIQVISAGVDRLPEDIRESRVVVTNVSGIHATPIGEFALHLMLSFVKGAPLYFQLKQEKKWKQIQPANLFGKTVGIVGLGSIGRETARLAKSFGMKVLATHRSAKEGERARNVDRVYPTGQLKDLLSGSDFVVLALPLTAETESLIGRPELEAMKPSAYLINIARGGVVDEVDLIRALEEHRIAGAGLDVFAVEPLPPESKLWELPNVMISSHISGVMPNYMAYATEVFSRNLARYLEGKKLMNRVNKELGY